MADVDREIVSCVDRVLGEVFGEFAKRAVINTLAKKGVTLEDAATHPEIFLEGLRELFGSGASVLEKSFVFELSGRLGVSLGVDSSQDFAKFVEELRKKKHV